MVIKRIHEIGIFFCLMPYLGWGGLPSDVQPLALIFSFFGLFLLALEDERKLYFPFLASIILFMMLASYLSLYLNALGLGWGAGDLSFVSILRGAYGYTASFFVFLYIVNLLKKRVDVSWVRICDLVVVITYFGFALNALGFTDVIQIFVSRAIFEGDAGGARGLTSFYPEQSRISTQMIVIGAVYLYFKNLNLVRLLAIFMAALLSFSGQFFINLMVVAVSYYVGWFAYLCYSGRLSIRRFFVLVLGLFITALVVISINKYQYELIDLGVPSRGVSAIVSIMEAGSEKIGSDEGILYKVSGLTQAAAVLVTHPLNFQVGTALFFEGDTELVERYREILRYWFDAIYYPMPDKTYSIFGSWVMDFGLLGLIAIIFILMLLFRNVTQTERVHLAVSLAVVFVYLFLFRSNNSEPTVWIILAIIACLRCLDNAGSNRSI